MNIDTTVIDNKKTLKFLLVYIYTYWFYFESKCVDSCSRYVRVVCWSDYCYSDGTHNSIGVIATSRPYVLSKSWCDVFLSLKLTVPLHIPR